MTSWLFLLGGPIIWLAHFSAIYTAASVADVTGRADQPAALWTVAALTAAGLAANGALLVWGAQRPRFLTAMDAELADFWQAAGAGGALISAVAVLWQGLPGLLGH